MSKRSRHQKRQQLDQQRKADRINALEIDGEIRRRQKWLDFDGVSAAERKALEDEISELEKEMNTGGPAIIV